MSTKTRDLYEQRRYLRKLLAETRVVTDRWLQKYAWDQDKRSHYGSKMWATSIWTTCGMEMEEISHDEQAIEGEPPT